MPHGLTMPDVPREHRSREWDLLPLLLETLSHQQLSPTAGVSTHDVRLLILSFRKQVFLCFCVRRPHHRRLAFSRTRKSRAFTLPRFPEGAAAWMGRYAPHVMSKALGKPITK